MYGPGATSSSSGAKRPIASAPAHVESVVVRMKGSAAVPLTAAKGSAPKTKEQKRREAEARNRAYAALKNHRKRIAEIDAQLERDNARMEEVLALLADPDFYTNEDSTTDIIAEHAQLKQRIEQAELEWFQLNEELEEEMARQASAG